MKSIHHAIAATAIAFASMLPLAATASSTVSLNSGSMVTSKMNQTIDSGSAHVGDRFSLTVESPYPSNSSAFSNAQLYGHVTRVVRAGQGQNPVLEFGFDRVTLASGRTGTVSMLIQSQETQRHNNLGNVAMTAVGGMIIGNIIGKSLLKTNLGGAAGLIAGALYANNKRTNVSLKQGSVVVTEVRQTVALAYPRTTAQASHR
jgi:hypothetical protein